MKALFLSSIEKVLMTKRRSVSVHIAIGADESFSRVALLRSFSPDLDSFFPARFI